MVDSMMDSVPTIEELIHLVEVQSSAVDPLERLTESVVLAGHMSDLGDELIGHFVDMARTAGATWVEVGECMGVSKQAAQKRFTRRGPRRSGGFFLTRFADESREVTRRALMHARDLGRSEVGTEHIVLGLLDDPETMACRAIRGLGASLDDIRAGVQPDLRPSATETPGRRVPLAADTKKAIELSLREAIRNGDRRIATQHILLGVLRSEGSPGARLLVEHGVTRRAIEAWVEEA